MMMEKKHLSTIANDVIRRCALEVDVSVDILNQEFEREWEGGIDGYSRKLVEFCCKRALPVMCGSIDETISDASFSRFTFDMMLAWEMPSSADEESHTECVAKEEEEKKVAVVSDQPQDDVSLFYSDLMPLLIDREPTIGEEAFVWLGTLVPLVVDTVNGRFTYETLTAPTGNRLHFPAYDKFLKEMHRCIKHLQKQDTPTGAELADDEIILHVEGTASSQSVVRHVGRTSWAGRLTLTNYALYFEASGVVSYEHAVKLDLSNNIEQTVKPAATGPCGAPLFDKAIVYESCELEEGIVLEFPEMTSSTRRDHWLALVTEIMLLNKFISKFNVESEVQVWEMHARTILGIIRLHAAREMLRMCPPEPRSFLIFALLDELPKGNYVLEELSGSLKGGDPCKNLSSLEGAIHQSREEAKEIDKAKDTTRGLKEEGIGESAQVLMGLLKPVTVLVSSIRDILRWEQPVTTSVLLVSTLILIYKEWAGPAISTFLLWVVGKMLWLRRTGVAKKSEKIVIGSASDQTVMESIVSAQQGLRTIHEIMRETNVALLKIWSILVSKAPKHTNRVMIVMIGAAIVPALIPFKFLLMGLVLYCAVALLKLGKHTQSEQGNPRLREWWDSIPVVPVEINDKESDTTT
ncbi:hypothetical protein ACS0TY_026505 [Phlomoides rotata]